MAKKKAVPSTKGKSTSSVKPKRPAKRPPTKKLPAEKRPASKAPASQRVVSHEQIGQAAGEVWQALSEQGDQSLAALKKSTGAPADLVLAAVGWLAREEKLDFATNGRSVKVSLR